MIVSVALSSCQFRNRLIYLSTDKHLIRQLADKELTLLPLHSAVWTFLPPPKLFAEQRAKEGEGSNSNVPP